MKRLAAAAVCGTFLLGMTAAVHAEPRQEVIRQWYCDVREHVYVQSQGEQKPLVGQCNTSPRPHPQTCWEVKTTFIDGHYTDEIRCNPLH